MRYEIRFRNGAWKIFDSHRYEDVAAFSLQKTAIAALDRAVKG